MTLLVVSITRALLFVAGLTLIFVCSSVGGCTGFFIMCFTFFFVFSSVSLLTDRLVSSVALVLIMSLILCLIIGLTSLLICH